jgi:DNA repair protein SbcC/Rad50
VRIRTVTAHAFGPFAGERLELAEGMTVIVGPNESGKSSWHAAIYAALCGIRRGPGLRREDREFRDRHAPWNGDEWRISCVVDLPDGRTVELIQDLSRGVSSGARDMTLGTDLTDEIIHDGAPDGSRWLGLERRAFHAVALIRQAHILSVAEDAGALQAHLQRAAATAGTDETAAAALQAIEEFSRDHVGSTQAPTKPLMKATRRLERAVGTHAQAVRDHEDWLGREERLARLEAQAATARRHARAAEARHAEQVADRLDERLREAGCLAERHPVAPPELRSSERLVQQVATALHDWQERPHPEPLDGPTAREIEERLTSLPEPPTGDLEPAEATRPAHRALLDAQQRYQTHAQHEPVDPGEITEVSLTEAELIDLARELEAPLPSVDPGLRSEVERLRQSPTRFPTRRPRVAGTATGILALASLIAGTVLLAGGATIGGAAAIGVGVVLGLVSGILLLRPAPIIDDRDLASAEARLMMAEQLAAATRQRREAAETRARQAALDPDPTSLRRLADGLRRSEDARAARAAWQTRERELTRSLADAATALRIVVAERGVPVAEDADVGELEAALGRYEEECRLRRDQAALASQRPALEQALTTRRRAEAQLAADVSRAQRAQAALHEASSAAGVTSDDDHGALLETELVERLQSWQRDREQRADEAERARQEWARLQALLDGSSLEELAAAAGAARERAAELREGLDEDLLRDAPLEDDPERTIRRLREQAEQLEQEAAATHKELEVRAEQVLSVAEAEEELAAAQETLDRVRTLDDVLQTTRRFLSAAQERVHRSIAPVLAGKVGHRLVQVTGGRYSEVVIDPESLRVKVRDASGAWRNADLLSHGTAEQVYLLLRVAMAEILTSNGANCPLLLDDSTVQSDPQRTRAILDVLHEVSTEHQVILFSQEDDVLDWARENLGAPDRLHSLEVETLRA